MRLFSGATSGTKKPKLSASQMFKQQQNAKKGGPPVQAKSKDQEYKDMLAARVLKLTEEAMLGKKGGFHLPGTKSNDQPRELTKNQKMMLEMLAMQKMQKEAKAKKKMDMEWLRKQKSIKNSAVAAKAAANEAIEQANREYQAQQAAASQQSYFFGSGDDNKNGGGWGW